MSHQQAAIASMEDAERTIGALHAIMDRLEQTLAEETALVRAGRLREVGAFETEKNELARRYSMESQRIGAAHAFIKRALPQLFDALRQRHVSFQALLKANMTVLATAHAVSEGIIRSVSGELARKRAPSTYGNSGRTNAPNPKASQPLALSRVL